MAARQRAPAGIASPAMIRISYQYEAFPAVGQAVRRHVRINDLSCTFNGSGRYAANDLNGLTGLRGNKVKIA